jgi:hypothetical protein
MVAPYDYIYYRTSGKVGIEKEALWKLSGVQTI